MYFLGVDAGGTKTAFVLCDETGKVLARHRGAGGGFLSIGVQGVEKGVREGMLAVCERAGIVPDMITWTGAGFPGYGEVEGSETQILQACRRAVGSDRVTCACDCHLGWAGSMALQPGINIVAGTGSICYGVDEDGKTARSSGWGAYCDEGSCTWIGGRLIAAFAKQSDGRRPRTALYGMFREALEIEEDAYFIHTLNHDIAGKRGETAKLQMLAMRIAQAGDPVAKAIYEDAAAELCEAIVAVAHKLGMADGFTASYSGGLFQSGACITEPLGRLVAQSGGKLQAPAFPPEIGAVLMAMHAYDAKLPIPKEFA